jgi:hypothetical protein
MKLKYFRMRAEFSDRSVPTSLTYVMVWGHTKETGNRNATAVSEKCRRFQAGNWFPAQAQTEETYGWSVAHIILSGHVRPT